MIAAHSLFESVLNALVTTASNTSLATVQTVAQNTANATADQWTNFVTAIATLVSVLSGVLVYFIQSPKIKSAAQLAGATADKAIEHADDIKTLAKVTYSMLPEESAKIVDAQNVRLAALEEKLRSTSNELSKLKKDAKA